MMAKSNKKYLSMNLFSSYLIAVEPEVNETQEPFLMVKSKFSHSHWYKDIIFYIQNLIFPSTWDKSKATSMKLKAIKNSILGEFVFWNDPRGILLNCIIEEETKGIITEF
jgi:hypothetical protein